MVIFKLYFIYICMGR